MDKKETRINYLCDTGMLETVCFEISEPKIYWYTMCSDHRLVYSVDHIPSSVLFERVYV